MGGQQVSSSVSFDALPPLVVEHIASFMMLSPYVNDVAANLRVVCKAWRRALQRVEHRTVHLASPCHSPAFSTLCAGPFGQAALGAMTLVRRRQLLALVARSGNLENLQIAVAAAGCAPDDTAATAAAASGHLEVCRWLLASRPGPLQPQVLKDMMQAAAEHGHEAVMRWLADAAGGHAGTAQLVCPSVLAAAVRGGQSQLVDQLVSEVRHAAPAPQRASRMRGHPVRSVRERSLYERLMAAAKYRPAAELEALWAAEAAGAELTQLQLLSAAAGSGLPDYQRKAGPLISPRARSCSARCICLEEGGCHRLMLAAYNSAWGLQRLRRMPARRPLTYRLTSWSAWGASGMLDACKRRLRKATKTSRRHGLPGCGRVVATRAA